MTDPTRGRWALIEEALHRVRQAPPDERDAHLGEACGDDPDLRRDVESLLAAGEASFELGEVGVVRASSPPAELTAGTSFGPYRVVRLLGRGGMGEVYLGERADGRFQQQVAIKLLRAEARQHLRRFEAERRILARLEHPGISRLLDSGETADGHPYMVMEYVPGEPLLDYCRGRELDRAARLRLFQQICDAVAFAHANLVVHRDLKPSNILVVDGRAKLLDFGIAKLLGPASGLSQEATLTGLAPLTPGHAAPEQLEGKPITIATDVYALGVILYELLTDRSPWRHLTALSISEALRRLVHEDPRPPSEVAGAPSARALRGDLDAIVLKAMRKRPVERYGTVDALWQDIEHHRRGEPVAAGPDSVVYRARKFLRRHRLAAATTAAIVMAIAAGVAVALWQAGRARAEADRALATKNFLLGLFDASNPLVAKRQLGAETTAIELLENGADRIEKEFAGQPELQIELLGMTADIFGNLADEGRHARLRERRAELVRRHYGRAHPIALEWLIHSDLRLANERQDRVNGERLLAEADALLRESGQDGGKLRADWWMEKVVLLWTIPGSEAEQARALEEAIGIYARIAPNDGDYAGALSYRANLHRDSGDHQKARALQEQALAVLERAPKRSDAQIRVTLTSLAREQEAVGELDLADQTYERAVEMSRQTFGERHSTYWITRAHHARMVHRRGERERAHAMFTQLLAQIPPGWTADTGDWRAREMYAACLAAEGRATEAIAILQAAQPVFVERPFRSGDLRRLRLTLGDAYDRAGRTQEARTALKAALDEYLGPHSPDLRLALAARERWGRFLLAHSAPGSTDFQVAIGQFREIVQQAADRPWVETAAAHAGLARAALLQSDLAAAQSESAHAIAALERARESHDVRVAPTIWLVRSEVLRRSGDRAGAREWAQRSLDASLRHDPAAAPSVAAARAALNAAGAA